MALWLLFTCGYPFSGKSTLSRAIGGYSFDVVSVDNQFDRPGIGTWRDAYLAAHIAVDRLTGARSVVFDSVGHAWKNRIGRKAQGHGAGAMAI